MTVITVQQRLLINEYHKINSLCLQVEAFNSATGVNEGRSSLIGSEEVQPGRCPDSRNTEKLSSDRTVWHFYPQLILIHLISPFDFRTILNQSIKYEQTLWPLKHDP